MSAEISALQKARAAYQPKLPKALRAGNISIQFGEPTEPATDKDDIKKLFSNTYGQPVAKMVEGNVELITAPMRVCVFLSGGHSPC